MEKARDEIRAVFFDLGETLLNFGRVKTLRLFTEGARLSYDFLEDNDKNVGGFRWYYIHSMVLLYMHRLVSGITGNDFNVMTLLKKTGAKRGMELNDAQWAEYAWCWYKPLERRGQLEEGVKETLGKLKQMGLKLGIVSNTFVPGNCLDRHLETLGMLGFFDVRFYSYEFEFRKPDVRIFKAAAERIGEDAANTAFVGDRINKDIKPALKTGMRAVLKSAYTNAGKPRPAGIFEIEKLGELPVLIEKINRDLTSASRDI